MKWDKPRRGLGESMSPAVGVLFAVLVLSCGRAGEASPGRAPGAEGAVSRDPVVRVDRSDPALRDIGRRAREELPFFFRKMWNPGPGEGNFMVKYPLPAEEGSGFHHEQIWLRDISYSGGVYSGVAANQPYYAAGLRAGDRVSFSIDDISDWMYTRDGMVIGGLSIKYLIEGIPELDRDRALSVFYQRFAPAETAPPVP